MKKIILVLSFLLLFPVNVFAQDYDISFAVGAGNRNAKVGILGARKYFKPLFERGSFSATPSFGFYGTYIDVKPS